MNSPRQTRQLIIRDFRWQKQVKIVICHYEKVEIHGSAAEWPVPSLLRLGNRRPAHVSRRYAVNWAFPRPLFSTGTAAADRKKYGGMGVAELRTLRQLEEQNAHLKKLLADLSLDKQILKDVIKKKL